MLKFKLKNNTIEKEFEDLNTGDIVLFNDHDSSTNFIGIKIDMSNGTYAILDLSDDIGRVFYDYYNYTIIKVFDDIEIEV